MAEIEKKILHAPDLPPSVAGDGRYLMTLLQQFLALQAQQVNAANGFKAEEVEAIVPRRKYNNLRPKMPFFL